MKVVYTLRHRAHHPERELEDSRFQEPFEHPGRAEIIRAALAADGRFGPSNFDAKKLRTPKMMPKRAKTTIGRY